MLDHTVMQAALLAGAIALCALGLAWLALAMETHWTQVRGSQPLTRGKAFALRVLGSLALLASLLICLRVDHPTMAALVWVMALAASALVVAFTFSWRPRWFAPLLVWVANRG